jgi:fructoselysine-6-P-deglycase FrlB-like protein
LEDLRSSQRDGVTAALDAWLEVQETDEFSLAVNAFVDACAEAHAGTGRIYAVCCGSSFNAAKLGSMLFAEIAGTPLTPAVPGDFRAQIQPTLRDGDVLVVVSQSGETKDVVDILTRVRESGRSIAILSLVNNINSTIAQEIADVVIPLRCGPEIAVAATKSFVNQLAVFHGLACELGRRTRASGPDSETALAHVDERFRLLERIPGLIERTAETTRDAVEEAADLLFLRPSSHILGTRMSAVALEGALKIREVVLNHTQGYEAAEFKHGPNTILGRNTLYGPEQVRALLAALGDTDPTSVFATPTGDLVDAMTSDYPLVYVTGPGTQDVALTISQVNTHKIRGAVSIAIAEENAGLRQAIEKAPSDNASYQSLFITLPATGDFVGTMYTATVVMQRLALRMSEKKAAYLDAAGVEEHGVHPDVPKNVSKSITVD